MAGRGESGGEASTGRAGRAQHTDLHAASMARAARKSGRSGLRSRLVSDPPAQRPRAPWSLRLVGVGVLALLAWLLFGSALSAARAVVALAGYVVVALLAYVVGKWVGRHQASR